MEKLVAKFKRHHPDAQIPSKGTDLSVGFDVVAVGMEITGARLTKEHDGIYISYDLGFSVEPPEGYYFDLVPRSSIRKHNVQFMHRNSPGVIDPDYTGSLKMVFTKPPGPTIYKVGDKVGQLILRKIYDCEFEVVEEINETERGEGGFGSTGE